jgi:hypothetical protein
MAIPLEQARGLLDDFNIPQVKNLFAQAHAKHVLYEVREAPENFPPFDPNLDDKVTFAAYSLLAAACSIVEKGDRAGGIGSLEKAASLLQYIHGPRSKDSRESGFHMLVSAMAFYAAGHYSRAFVSIRAIEEQTPATRIIAAFLRKDAVSLLQRLNEVLLVESPILEDQLDLDGWAISVAIARALALVLEFIFIGTKDFLIVADKQLEDAIIVASAGSHPAWWWIIRLLRLMLRDLGNASLWQVLPSYFDPSSALTLGRYIRLLAFSKRPVTELWTSQRAALPLSLNEGNRGAVINLPTSSGKTRIAELTILQTLLSHPTARIFYLAPFRSLALEVEHTLTATFSWLGYGVSHLYGGSRVSSVDTELAAESAIIIVTPEKARALYRASPELYENVKLLIIDEGHLIGADERYVRNELFIDHLRCIAHATNARVLLLSAVLPNPQELAEWVTGDPTAVASSEWRPSAERFGLLRWNGSRVRIDWQGEVASFNPAFVQSKPLGFIRRRKLFPSDKYEAAAAVAVRLSSIGPVMIFTGRAVSVPTLARAVLLALGEQPEDHPWPEHEWKVFKAVCNEELAPDAIELQAAHAGVICHSNRLTPQVRLALEHLMRAKPPKIIIATTTLAQGVNIGISAVIIASPFTDQHPIKKRDFWNICGRAGRAFVDGEGKILYAIDDTRERWQIRRDERLAQSYFNTIRSDPVKSGLFYIVSLLRRIAAEAGVSFKVLLELAANNDFSRIGEKKEICENICDLLDDELIALHTDSILNPSVEDPAIWIDRVFRNSLAIIQARSSVSEKETEEVLAFLRARAESSLHRIPELSARKAIVSSGLPLSVAISAHNELEFFRGIADSYNESAGTLQALVSAVENIEEWARIHAAPVTNEMPKASKLDALREGWLRGIGLRVLSDIVGEARVISKDLYGYQLPWLIHAASQQLRSTGDTERADILSKIALLVELGVPTERAARIFLAGVRSRAAATELAALDIAYGNSIPDIRRKLRNSAFVDNLRMLVSPPTSEWLELLITEAAQERSLVPEFRAFKLRSSEKMTVLHVRQLNDQIFLCTADGRMRIPVKANDRFPFDRVANDPRVVFVRSGSVWYLTPRDPRLEMVL